MFNRCLTFCIPYFVIFFPRNTELFFKNKFSYRPNVVIHLIQNAFILFTDESDVLIIILMIGTFEVNRKLHNRRKTKNFGFYLRYSDKIFVLKKK